MSRPKKYELKLNEAQRELVANNFGLVGVAFKKIAPGPLKERYGEEILMAGHVGLCRAAMMFKPELGTIFSGYAVNRIYSEMLSWIQWHQHKYGWVKVLSLEKEIAPELTLGDVIEDTHIDVEESGVKAATAAEILQIMNKYVNKLDAKALMLYAGGLTYKEIGEQMGCTKQKVEQRIRRAREIILRKYNYGWVNA